MVCLSALALAASLGGVLSREKIAGKPTHFILHAFFVGAIFTSLASKLFFGAAVSALLNFSPTSALFLLTLINVNSIDRLRKTCAAVAYCTFVLAACSVVSYHTGIMADRLVLRQAVESNSFADSADPAAELIPALDNSGRNLWRIRSLGFLTDPNDFGQAVVMALPLLLGFYRVRQKLRNLFLILIPAVTFGYAIYLTHSRGALLGFIAIALSLAKRKLKAAQFTVVLVMLGILGLAAKSLAGGRSFSSDEESAGGRIDAWSEGLTMLFGHPFFGVGYGKFTDHHNYTAHNTFVLCFAELGLIGYFVWIAVLVWSFKGLNQAVRILPPQAQESRWAELLRTSLIGFLVCAFFLSRTYVPNLYILLALCLCAAACARWHIETLPVTTTATRIEWKEIHWAAASVKVVLASIALVYIIVRLKNSNII